MIINDESHFKGAFSTIYQALKINFDKLAIKNYKGLRVEMFHRYLNKKNTISTQDRSIVVVFVPVYITTRYALNSAPIDSADILHSILVIGRKLCFFPILAHIISLLSLHIMESLLLTLFV